jgi:hypothetical protein
MPTPEELARINIDRQLTACGWTVQSSNEMNLYASLKRDCFASATVSFAYSKSTF